MKSKTGFSSPLSFHPAGLLWQKSGEKKSFYAHMEIGATVGLELLDQRNSSELFDDFVSLGKLSTFFDVIQSIYVLDYCHCFFQSDPL